MGSARALALSQAQNRVYLRCVSLTMSEAGFTLAGLGGRLRIPPSGATSKCPGPCLGLGSLAGLVSILAVSAGRGGSAPASGGGRACSHLLEFVNDEVVINRCWWGYRRQREL
jgi:hypothetical protein